MRLPSRAVSERSQAELEIGSWVRDLRRGCEYLEPLVFRKVKGVPRYLSDNSRRKADCVERHDEGHNSSSRSSAMKTAMKISGQ